MKLIFENSKHKKRVIATPSNIEEVYKEINKFLNEHNFKCYYIRTWKSNGRLVFDVGSHTEFFYLEGMTYEEYISSFK